MTGHAVGLGFKSGQTRSQPDRLTPQLRHIDACAFHLHSCKHRNERQFYLVEQLQLGALNQLRLKTWTKTTAQQSLLAEKRSGLIACGRLSLASFGGAQLIVGRPVTEICHRKRRQIMFHLGSHNIVRHTDIEVPFAGKRKTLPGKDYHVALHIGTAKHHFRIGKQWSERLHYFRT